MQLLALGEAAKDLAEVIKESNKMLRFFLIKDEQSELQSWVLGERMAEMLLQDFSCRVEWEKEHKFGIWMVYVPELDVWGKGDTEEEAAEDLVSAAVDYMEVFLKCIPFYFGIGRKKHLPYIVRLFLVRGNRDKIRAFLGLS